MKKYIFLLLFALSVLNACSDYLDVVPEGISRLENSFAMRSQAIRYLYTCYSYMPKNGDITWDPGILGGDEMWAIPNTNLYELKSFDIARGYQNATTPLIDDWDKYYRALRDCNIFLDNIGLVPDMQSWEINQWTAEAKTLKAYYHFCLLRMYGPVPIIKKNLPVTASEEEARVYRDPVDSCVNYIVQLLDEAKVDLPLIEKNPTDELGRITQPVAYALKAQVLVTAASPLFNGNNDQVTLKNDDGTQLFNQTVMVEKWQRAAEACAEAIDVCVNQAGKQLYVYPGNATYRLTDTIKTELTLRNAFCTKWNSDIIWANTQSRSRYTQEISTPNLDRNFADAFIIHSILGMPLKIVEQFYTDKGIPLNEDNSWISKGKYTLRSGAEAEKLYVKTGASTVQLHFDREPRFYAWVGFDAGIWYGQGKYNDKNVNDLFYVACKKNEVNSAKVKGDGPVTGYFPKKYIDFENVQTGIASYSIQDYPWPILRLSDLFLLYAEALNEAADNDQNRVTARQYVDKVRERASLQPVDVSWSTYSNNPNKYITQTGLRQIIQQERMIELAFEGQRFWDIRRWKIAANLYKTPIEGWDLTQSSAQYFYRNKIIAKQVFGVKDYFWPIRNSNIIANNRLVQNIGW